MLRPLPRHADPGRHRHRPHRARGRARTRPAQARAGRPQRRPARPGPDAGRRTCRVRPSRSAPSAAPARRAGKAGWSELLEEAATGEIAFPGGALRMSPTPAMTLFDVDGEGAPAALALAGARAAAAAILRHGIGGSIGIDLPTVGNKAARQAVDRALADAAARRRTHRDERLRLRPARPPPRTGLAARIAAGRSGARRRAGAAAPAGARSAAGRDSPPPPCWRGSGPTGATSLPGVPVARSNGEPRERQMPRLRRADRARTQTVLQPRLPRPRPAEMAGRGLSHPRPRRRPDLPATGLDKAETVPTNDPLPPRASGRARVAQLVEHATENRSVGGSTPSPGTIFQGLSVTRGVTSCLENPERPRGAMTRP